MAFDNIHIETRLHTGDWWGQGEPINITAMQLLPEKPVIGKIRNLHFNNITSTGENSVVMIADPQTVIENVYFTNFDFTLRRSNIDGRTGRHKGEVTFTTAKSAATIDVRDYGAKGDGTTINTKALQRATDDFLKFIDNPRVMTLSPYDWLGRFYHYRGL